jgi:hypothetical protein
MEDTEFDQVRALLRTVEPPPGNVDVASVLGAGRRNERRHRLTVALTAGGLTAIVLVGAVGAVTFARNDDRTTPAAAASHSAPAPAIQLTTPPTSSDTAACTVQTLSAPAGADSALADTADLTGRLVVGDSTKGDNQGPSVLWTNGAPTLLNEPKSLVDDGVQVKGVNSRGDVALVVGASHIASWLYHGGKYTKLPKVAGYPDALATAIGPNGDVVGWTDSAASTGGPAVLWPADRPGTVRKLATPHGQPAMAMTIDAAGTVGGSLGDGQTPYVWNASGHGHALKVPTGYQHGRVFGVNGDWAVGWVGVGGSGQVVAARWNLSTGKVTVFPDNDEGMSIASNGDFVGGDGGYSDGYLYHNGAFKLLPLPAKASRAGAQFITPDGKTIVGSVTQHQDLIPAIWHC